MAGHRRDDEQLLKFWPWNYLSFCNSHFALLPLLDITIQT